MAGIQERSAAADVCVTYFMDNDRSNIWQEE